jgi:hypothetical protein
MAKITTRSVRRGIRVKATGVRDVDQMKEALDEILWDAAMAIGADQGWIDVICKRTKSSGMTCKGTLDWDDTHIEGDDGLSDLQSLIDGADLVSL